MTARLRAGLRTATLLCWVTVSPAAVHATQNPATTPAAPLHVLKIASGPAGVEANGGFRFNEERSTFSRSDDREVVVFFQWEGVPGPHKLGDNLRLQVAS
jgi:hypothetical protein